MLPVPQPWCCTRSRRWRRTAGAACCGGKHVRWRAGRRLRRRLRPRAGAVVVLPLRAEQAGSALLLGVTPFLVRLIRPAFSPTPKAAARRVYGIVCMTLMLLTGVAGPLLDSFFLGGKLDRREIVATKAMCQIFGHARSSSISAASSSRPAARSGARRARDPRRWSAPSLAKRRARTDDRPAVPPSGRTASSPPLRDYFVVYGGYVLAAGSESGNDEQLLDPLVLDLVEWVAKAPRPTPKSSTPGVRHARASPCGKTRSIAATSCAGP